MRLAHVRYREAIAPSAAPEAIAVADAPVSPSQLQTSSSYGMDTIATKNSHAPF